MKKIGIDIMGGDNAPTAPLSAAIEFAKKNNDCEIHCYGLEESFTGFELPNNIKKIVCSEKINSSDEPAHAIRNKKDSTMIVGATACSKDETDAFLSAGNTGALIASGLFIGKRIKGYDRPALPGFLPSANKKTPTIVLDLGANTETKAAHLSQYAKIASIYATVNFKIENPKVALLNIGEEENKGTELYQEAYKILKDNEEINFIGNVEARELLTTEIDIIVVDGFAGNMILKTLEGSAGFFKISLEKLFSKNILTKMGYLLVKDGLSTMKKDMDYKEVGATPIFGIKKLYLKAHGSSNERAFYRALEKASETIESGFIDKIQ